MNPLVHIKEYNQRISKEMKEMCVEADAGFQSIRTGTDLVMSDPYTSK